MSLNVIKSGAVNSHLLGDEVQPTVDSALRLELVLLEKHRADELVDGLIVLELLKLALYAEVLLLLRLELLP